MIDIDRKLPGKEPLHISVSKTSGCRKKVTLFIDDLVINFGSVEEVEQMVDYLNDFVEKEGD